MSSQNLYEEWIAACRNVPVARDFSAQTMKKIQAAPASTRLENFLWDTRGTARLIRYAIALALSAAGLFRITYVTCNLLIP